MCMSLPLAQTTLSFQARYVSFTQNPVNHLRWNVLQEWSTPEIRYLFFFFAPPCRLTGL